MAGHRNFKELTKQLDKTPGIKKRRAAAARKLQAELDAYDQGLRELRRAREFTQVQLADVLGLSQAQVSRIENETDMYLSTLASYIAAMGGQLKLVGVFEDERVGIELDQIVREREPA